MASELLSLKASVDPCSKGLGFRDIYIYIYKVRGTLLEVLVIRIIVFLGLFWVPLFWETTIYVNTYAYIPGVTDHGHLDGQQLLKQVVSAPRQAQQKDVLEHCLSPAPNMPLASVESGFSHREVATDA